jgi:hypothetical protein
MHDDNQFQSKPQSDSGRVRGADEATAKAWSDFERNLDLLGRQLAELSDQAGVVGATALSGLQARFDDVRRQATAWRSTTEQQVEEMRRMAGVQAQTAYGDARARSKEAAKQMWERSEPLRQGARDVGEGLIKAWGEVRTSLGKAASRLQTEGKDPSSPSSGNK